MKTIKVIIKDVKITDPNDVDKFLIDYQINYLSLTSESISLFFHLNKLTIPKLILRFYSSFSVKNDINLIKQFIDSIYEYEHALNWLIENQIHSSTNTINITRTNLNNLIGLGKKIKLIQDNNNTSIELKDLYKIMELLDKYSTYTFEYIKFCRFSSTGVYAIYPFTKTYIYNHKLAQNLFTYLSTIKNINYRLLKLQKDRIKKM